MSWIGAEQTAAGGPIRTFQSGDTEGDRIAGSGGMIPPVAGVAAAGCRMKPTTPAPQVLVAQLRSTTKP